MGKRRATILLMIVALLLTTVTGVALAKTVLCKPNKKCEGTKNADDLFGTSGRDRIFGLGGGDWLLGQGGGDKLVGGKGGDQLEGGDGDQANDTLDGGTQDDIYIFEGNWGDDVITDTASGDNDAFTGNNALFRNATGNLIINLISDPVLPEAQDAASTVNWAGNAIEGLYIRTLGDDTITGSNVADYIENLEDPDAGSGGNDTISGGGGDDNIQNSDKSGIDTISGDAGNDYMLNSDLTGNDIVDGGEGNDEIQSVGYDANEDNVIDPNTEDGGDDAVNGGEGDDTIDVKDGVGGDIVDCGDGTDTVKFDLPNLAAGDPGDTLLNPDACENKNP